MLKAGSLIFAVTAWLVPASIAEAQNTLPGTKPLILERDPAAAMVDGIHSFLDRETESAAERRAARWEAMFLPTGSGSGK